MAVSFSEFLVQLLESVHAEDGQRLAYLLRPTSPHGKELVKEFKSLSVCGPKRAKLRVFITTYIQRDTLMEQYGGCVDSPWDEIAIRYVMVTSHVARKRPGDAFNEQSQLISCVYIAFALENDRDHILYRLFFRFFTQNTGWTLPALFSMLRDLRDLAFDVCSLFDMLAFAF